MMELKPNSFYITKDDSYLISAASNESGRIFEIHYDKEEGELSSIYLAVVKDVVPYLNAAFVEYLPGKKAYLDFKKKDGFYLKQNKKGALCCGDLLLVQITKEAIGKKDPVASANLQFAGNALILNCGCPYVAISSKITSEKDRSHLTNLLQDHVKEEYGFICRSRAVDYSDEEILAEKEGLVKAFTDVVCRAKKNKHPSLIQQTPPPTFDLLSRDVIKKIQTDSVEVKKKLEVFLEKRGLKKEIEYLNHHERDLKETILEASKEALQPKVLLKSGAYLVIESMEAFHGVDVNSGHLITKKQGKNAFYKVNLEAAKELVFQMQLRGLSGMILVDFINMAKEEDQMALFNQIQEWIKADFTKTSLVDITALGLYEFTRRKSRQGLEKEFMDYCSQKGIYEKK